MSLHLSGFTRPLWLILLLLSPFISGCDTGSQSGSKQKKASHKVETTTASYQTIAIKRTLAGTLQPSREVRIINQLAGILMELSVYPGDQVKQGQILVRLDDARVKAELQKAKASLDQSRLDLKRLKDLAPKKLASESDIAQAQTQLDIAQAELSLKQTEFEHTQIKAPFDGIISERQVEPGDVLPLHTKILSIIDVSSLKAEINLSELILSSIRTGNQVDISIDALGQQRFQGQIARIYPTIDKTTRRGTFEIILKPVPEGARAGQLCRVTISTAEKSRLMIPYDAIRHDKLGSYVYRLKNDTAIRTNITTGVQQDKWIEVVSGLEDQQAIVSKGFFGLKDNMNVSTTASTISSKAP